MRCVNRKREDKLGKGAVLDMFELGCSPCLSVWAELGELPEGFCDATVSLEGIQAAFIFLEFLSMANDPAHSHDIPQDRAGVL